MMVSTHLMAGLLAGAGAVTWLKPQALGAAWVLGGALVGALLPDIDHPKSWLGRRIPFISMPIAAVFGHRGITHSLLAVVGLALALRYGLAQWQLVGTGWALVAVGVAAGYLSHIAGDFVTHGGVPLLWPVKRRFSSPLTFLTGGAFERLLGFALALGAGWVLLEHFAPEVLDYVLKHTLTVLRSLATFAVRAIGAV